MPSEKDNILEFNQFMKSDKIPYIIYGDIESLIRKWIDGCVNNAENSSVTKIGWGWGGGYIPCGDSVSAIWDFNNKESKNTLYRAEHCMKKFYESLREQMGNIIDLEIYILPLTNEELNSYQDAKYVTFVEKESQKRLLKIKIIEKSDIIVIIQVNTETQHIVLVIQNLMYLMKFL